VRVLVVEDDPDGRDAVALFLRAVGANVVAARSVGEAMDTLNTSRPDVILSDIGLPAEDGFSLLRQVRAREAGESRKTPVVALTGYVRPEDRSRILNSGFQAHVRKPFDPDEIVNTVASWATVASWSATVE
jgi:CheY-like chemotaxis protein